MGETKLSDSARPELVETMASCSVCGCSATWPRPPLTHHMATTHSPTPAPASRFSGSRAAREARPQAVSAPPTTSATRAIAPTLIASCRTDSPSRAAASSVLRTITAPPTAFETSARTFAASAPFANLR